MTERDPLHERYRELSNQLREALSFVAVTAKALTDGYTDLELKAAEVLEHASGMLTEVCNNSSTMWLEVKDLEQQAGRSEAHVQQP